MDPLYCVLAESADTPPALLTRLHLLAGGSQTPRTGVVTQADRERDRRRLAILTRLARNPSIPAEIRTALAAERDTKIRKALLERPGLTVDEALTLLADETRVDVLRWAVQHVEDPDGTLARFATSQNGSRYLHADLIASDKSTEQTRIHAAFDLARHSATPVTSDVDRVLAVARRHPHLAHRLLTDPDVCEPVKAKAQALLALTRPADPAVAAAPPAPGDRAGLTRWLAAPRRTRAEVLAYIAGVANPAAARQIVLEYRDVSGKVAHAALASHPTRPVAIAVLACPEASEATKRAATLRLAQDEKAIGWASLRHIGAILTDPGFASEVAQVAPHRSLRHHLVRHVDLTPAAIIGIARTLEHESDRASVTDWLWLATVPAATIDQRLKATEAIEVASVLNRNTQADLTWVLEWAHAGVRAATTSALEAVSTVPCATIRLLGGRSAFSGVLHLLAEALAEGLEALEDDDALNVLVALSSDFTGTFGDLLDMVVAVTHT